MVLSYAKTWKENSCVCIWIMCCHLWWLQKFTRDGSTWFRYIHIHIHKNWHAFSAFLRNLTSIFEIVFSAGIFCIGLIRVGASPEFTTALSALFTKPLLLKKLITLFASIDILFVFPIRWWTLWPTFKRILWWRL